MSAQKIQVDYQQLNQIAGVFSEEQSRTQSMSTALQDRYDALCGGWEGENATRFFASMTDDVMPAFQRLNNAYDLLQGVIRQIVDGVAQAEEDAASVVNPEKGAAAGEIYTVRPGDTLWDIARAHGTTVDALVAANNIANRDLIYPGQEIVIPGEGGAAPAPTPAPTPQPKVSPELGDSGRSPQQLNAKIDEFNVVGNPKYAKFKDGKPETYDTYCNLFASDVAQSMGAPLPLFVNNGGQKLWLGATDMKRWLDGVLDKPGQYAQGPASGWVKVNTADAVAAANQGYVTVVAGHGHMAVVRAGTPANAGKGDVIIAQAGENNFNQGPLKNGWGQFTPEAEFYVYKP